MKGSKVWPLTADDVLEVVCYIVGGEGALVRDGGGEGEG